MCSSQIPCLRYGDNDNLLPGFNFHGKGLKFYHLNVRSVLSKINEIRCFTDIIHLEASLIGFTETHLSNCIANSEILISGYNMFRYDRTTGPGGGVLVYALNTLKCTQRVDFQSDDIESI